MRIRRIVMTALVVTAIVVPGTSGVAMAASKSPMVVAPVSVSAASKSPMSVAPGSFSATSKSPMAAEPKGPKSSVKKSGKTS